MPKLSKYLVWGSIIGIIFLFIGMNFQSKQVELAYEKNVPDKESLSQKYFYISLTSYMIVIVVFGITIFKGLSLNTNTN